MMGGGGLGSMMATGMALGAGSAVGHMAVNGAANALMGSGSSNSQGG